MPASMSTSGLPSRITFASMMTRSERPSRFLNQPQDRTDKRQSRRRGV